MPENQEETVVNSDFRHSGAVAECSIATLEVYDMPAAVGERHLEMAARDEWVLHYEITSQVAADDGCLTAAEAHFGLLPSQEH